MYDKYKTYYDYKAGSTFDLLLSSDCLLPNPKLLTQSDFDSESLPSGLPVFRIQIFLTNSIYISQKVGTNYTQQDAC